MDDKRYITLHGEVVWRGAPRSIEGQHFRVSHFTIKCTYQIQDQDKQLIDKFEYYTLRCFSETELDKIRVGYIINCLARVSGREWRDENGNFKTREDYGFHNKQKTLYGSPPVVFYTLTLKGTITIVSDLHDKENFIENNKDFESDLPF